MEDAERGSKVVDGLERMGASILRSGSAVCAAE